MRPVFAVIELVSVCLVLQMGCSNSHPAREANTPSIVGVWEMTAVRLGPHSELPKVALVNKKDIYTRDGHYHDTAPESTRQTDKRLRSYKVEGDVLTLYRPDGERGRSARVKFLSPTVIELHADDGTIVEFKRISDDPEVIPAVEEKVVWPHSEPMPQPPRP